MSDQIQAGYQAFLDGGQEEFGAIKGLRAHSGEVLVYVENHGEFIVAGTAVTKVAFGKVWFDAKKLEPQLRKAIGRAHDNETL